MPPITRTPSYPSPWPHWPAVVLLGVGLLIPLLGYVGLPALGIGAFSQVFNFKRIVLLFGALIGGVAYVYYLQFVHNRPQFLVAFIVLLWPLIAYFNGLLMQVGINIHLRPLLILSIALPALWISLRNAPVLWRAIPWLKYYLIFFLWLVLYMFFYNANAVDPRLSGGEEALGEGSVSMVQLTAYFYCLMAITVSAVTALKVKNVSGMFDGLNIALLLISSLESIVTILGFPFGLFNMMLDGFTRATGIFTHPNPFAHHMGLLMVYFLGLFCYYQGERKHRMPVWLLLAGLGVNLIAFLLGLSKTALGIFSLCALFLFLLNLAVPTVRRSLLPIGLGLAVLVPVGLFGYQLLSGESFMSILESRMEQTQSMTWRAQIWQDLLAGLNGVSLLIGHGFTAANATVFRLTFNDAKNAQPLMMVHNAYIALLYDLGIMGYAMFAAALSAILHAVRGWIEAARPALRTEHSIIIALSMYFLAVCGFDEMSYMFDAPMLFWALITVLYCVSLREQTAPGETIR